MYVLFRDDVEVYRHPTSMAYIDTNVIQPYQTYTYKLRTCTVEGCADSQPVSIYFSDNISLIFNTIQGSQRNLETCKTGRFELYLSRSRNGLEFAPKSEKTWTKHEI